MTTKMTPADFRPATMVALATACDWRADYPVPFQPVVNKALALMGLTEDALGINKATGQPQTSRNCQMAYKYAADNGQGKRGKRGKWGLTQEGLNEASMHAATFGITPRTAPKAPKVLASTFGVTVAPTMAPTIAPTVGVSIALGRSTASIGDYHPDPYIRSLAIAQTPCFGSWSASAPTCGGCPLGNPCHNTLTTRASAIAARLIQEALAPKVTKVPPTVLQSKAEQTSTAGVASTMIAAFKDADEFFNRTDVTCVICGNDIVPGVRALWAEKVGQDPGGMAHKECGQPHNHN